NIHTIKIEHYKIAKFFSAFEMKNDMRMFGILGHFPKGGSFNELIFSFHPQMGNENIVCKIKQQKFSATFDFFNGLILKIFFEGLYVWGFDNSWPKHCYFSHCLSFYYLIESSFYTFNFW